MASNPAVRMRAALAGLVAASALLATPTGLEAHTSLVSSEPAAKSVLATSPTRIRLVFSEPVDASVSAITLTPAVGGPRTLAVQADPRAVAAIIAPLTPLDAGPYRVSWRTVSVDGHAVSGSFTFTVQGTASGGAVSPGVPPALPPVLPPAMPAMDTMSSDTGAPSCGPLLCGLVGIASLLRGLGLAALMAFAGLLWFVRGTGDSVAARLTPRMGAASLVLLTAHVVAWTATTQAAHRVDPAWIGAMMTTRPGAVELARLSAVLLSLWALVLARRRGIAATFAMAALVASGAIGHPAAMSSWATIPAKAVHLVAGALWLGGLVSLVTFDRRDPDDFTRAAARVSAVALWSVIAIVVTGVVQASLFLGSMDALLHTRYGALVAAKVIGVMVLVAFGVLHRTRHLPATADRAPALVRSVRDEIGVFLLVTLVGGALAYVPPHAGDHETGHAMDSGMEHRP